MKSSRILHVLLLTVFSLFLVSGVAAQTITTFDADLEGWTVTGDNASAWEATTGNPGGCLSVNDLAIGDGNLVIAPHSYHGNWSGMTELDSLSVDIFLASSDPDELGIPYIFRIAGPGGAAHILAGDSYFPVRNEWNRYSVSLDEDDWYIESGTWDDILRSVNSVRIKGEFISGPETVRIDNVRLTSSVASMFIPCVQDNFNSGGTGDWSFRDTGGASNPGSGGNGGGYVHITDQANTSSKGYAPPKYLGDWTPLNDNGFVTIDIRIITPNGDNGGAPEFIRISGPGGTASVSLAADELPAPRRIWKTYEFPISEDSWSVDSGTWTDLLANVTECRIRLEYYSSLEEIGFDNFGRLQADCADIDYPLTILGDDIEPCAFHSFVGIASSDYNPQDGRLYGLYKVEANSGGGIYPIHGSDAGQRLQTYDRPAHLIFDTDGDAFISENYSGIVFRLEWGGSSSSWVQGFHAGDDDPLGMTFAPEGFNGPNVSEGDVLIVDHGSNSTDGIYSFSPDVPENELLVTPDPGDVDFYDIAGASATTAYVVDRLTDNALFILDPSGALTPLVLSSPIALPSSVVYDSVKEDLYIACDSDHTVYRVDPTSGAVTPVIEGFTNFYAGSLAIDVLNRKLAVSDNGYNRVYEFCLSGFLASADPLPDVAHSWQLRVFPNPFNPRTTISFECREPVHAQLVVYDLAGRQVAILIEGWLEAGHHEEVWNGRDINGRSVAAGQYLVRLKTRDGVFVQKVILAK